MSNANEPSDSPDEFYRRLTIGNPALSLRDREAAALAEYLPLKERLIAGDDTTFSAYQKVAQVLLDVKREIHGSQTGYFDFLNEVTNLTKVIKDRRSYGSHMKAEPNPLGLWLALELRRARIAFDKSRKDQDADFESKGMRKTGVRVKLTLKSASEICVALADATIAKAGEFQSTLGQISEAETAVLAFTREIANSSIPLAFFVSGESGLGGSAVKAATDIGSQLYRDIEGAFALAQANLHGLRKQASPVKSIFAIWRDEAINEFEVERDNVNFTFSKANRTQSAYHINGLLEGAEKTIKALIAKARDLPLPDDEWSELERHAVSVFDELSEQIREIAIGANGRAPRPENVREADRLMQPVRKRIVQEFEKLRLSKQFSEHSSFTVGASSPEAFITAAPEPPKYRVKGTGDLIPSGNSQLSLKNKGRARGTGYQRADARILEKMGEAIASNPALNATSAAKLFTNEAVGASVEAKVDRLSRAFRAGRNGE